MELFLFNIPLCERVYRGINLWKYREIQHKERMENMIASLINFYILTHLTRVEFFYSTGRVYVYEIPTTRYIKSVYVSPSQSHSLLM